MVLMNIFLFLLVLTTAAAAAVGNWNKKQTQKPLRQENKNFSTESK